MPKFAILGYDTINIGDDIQSLCTTFLLPKIDYIILRDDYDKVWDYETKEPVTITEQCVLILNGWFMHDPNRKYALNNFKFPIKNELITPVFISTCLPYHEPIHTQLYVPECVEYYKKWEPIYARDNATFEMLQKHDIKTFLSGCLTQTLDRDNIPDNEMYKDKIILADVDVRQQGIIMENHKTQNVEYVSTHHYDKQLAETHPKDRLEKAKEILSIYKNAKKVYTTRLHCFLPVKAMGVDVEYIGDTNIYRMKGLLENDANVEKQRLKELFNNLLEKI
jgi:hypothetical protein